MVRMPDRTGRGDLIFSLNVFCSQICTSLKLFNKFTYTKPALTDYKTSNKFNYNVNSFIPFQNFLYSVLFSWF